VGIPGKRFTQNLSCAARGSESAARRHALRTLATFPVAQSDDNLADLSLTGCFFGGQSLAFWTPRLFKRSEHLPVVLRLQGQAWRTTSCDSFPPFFDAKLRAVKPSSPLFGLRSEYRQSCYPPSRRHSLNAFFGDEQRPAGAGKSTLFLYPRRKVPLDLFEMDFFLGATPFPLH